MTEVELIQACKENNPRAQKILFETYSARLMGVCLRYASNGDEAQDMLQDGFIKIFQKLNTFSGEGAFGGWMRRTMVNTCLDQIRKNNRIGYAVEIEKVEIDYVDNEDALSKMRTQELLGLIQKLPEGYRIVFNMFVIEGYSHKEIAKELEITESTSKSQLRKAKIRLQKEIIELEKITY